MMPFPQIFLLGIVIPWTSTAAAAQSLPRCPDRCGNCKVPCPFGMAKDCYTADKIFITCNQTFQPPKAFVNGTNLPLSNISLEGELTIWQSIARECRNHSQKATTKDLPNRAAISLPQVTFSGKCTSLCDSNNITYESCSGVRCCQIPIPSGLTNVTVPASSFRSGNYSKVPDSDNHREGRAFNPCSYAFVVEESKFSFSNSSFEELENTEMLPLVVDWAIGDEKCKEAEKRSNFSCKGNSSCVEPSKDSAAFDFGRRLPLNQGNPYVDDGCQDIDECEIRKIGKCRNLPENWSSHCLAGYVRTETGCSKLHGSRLGKSFLRHAAHGTYIYIDIIEAGRGRLWRSGGLWSDECRFGSKKRKRDVVMEEREGRNDGLTRRRSVIVAEWKGWEERRGGCGGQRTE
ncbi:hypothetical protein FEM48_Zijuj01G0102300 [Ziziphus jujuba var. spinosa]|uniref:Wall-associated receptor kinase galacturonan-binding domain-containing protein n=1 Tax=Ziziphus jujuba var. spinosa TaxID=714518 RepID=A0A978W0N4_ZIZJJ|nr:hypothetical protein FEM48_Zijuj01G0102300 [Ziziphus jujuba var. spinosa]